MSEGWHDSGQTMRHLGDIVDAVSRVVVAVSQVARDHADCDPLLMALDSARGNLANAEMELHNHARAFEEAARMMDERDERDRD